MSLLMNYTLFAIFAITANVLSQEATLWFYRGAYELWFTIPIGTAVGLVVKYLLDRKYIFSADTLPLHRDARQFLAYAGTGAITTALFWGTEILFDVVFDSREARYGGAILGLSVGYWLKYRLDKRFVFAKVRRS